MNKATQQGAQGNSAHTGCCCRVTLINNVLYEKVQVISSATGRVTCLGQSVRPALMCCINDIEMRLLRLGWSDR